ncbi:protein pitchfork [Ammospiza nelsoni]|uniref:protein pitchfork n=1 Tax=Ammospiza caudacuta TaxID=2857398 RepID=UPI0027389CAD|nr:protein pitchfork [Ammospiza caudacuta]XP_059343714.1 protein pitchfork [Ammospiza nelsoni]
MAARQEPRAMSKLISFGTTQDRKMFPSSFAPDRLGIEVLGVRGSPLLGPGSYLGPENNVLQSSWSTRPMSALGYVMGARTAPRFQQRARTVTPGPAAYGPFPAEPRPARPGPAPVPFSSSSPRFPTRLRDRDRYPGPGSYDIREPQTKKVSWPSRFGAPNGAALPQPVQRMVKMQVQKMTVDKNFQKNQGREAYLKLHHG